MKISLTIFLPSLALITALLILPQRVHAQNQQTNRTDEHSIVIKIPSKSGSNAFELSKLRFHENRYGISFRQPAGTVRVLQTADDAIVKYIFPGRHGISMGFYIRHQHHTIDLRFSKDQSPSAKVRSPNNNKPLSIESLVKQAREQFSFAYPSARQVKAKSKITPAGRPGAVIYFLVADKQKGSWVAGQAFMLIDPHTVALFQMQCDAKVFNQTKKLFEQFIKSTKVMSLEKLNAIRDKRITAASQWLKNLTKKNLTNQLLKDQWYRIVQGKRDVGYRRVTYQPGKQMGKEGLNLIVQSKINDGDLSFVSLGQFFASFDQSMEMWSRRTRKKSKADKKTRLPGAVLAPKHAGWAETGICSDNLITVSRQTPTSIREYHWPKPLNQKGQPLPYISQAMLPIALSLLPHQSKGQFAFYAYSVDLAKITLHLVWVKPLKNGKFKVIMRPAPDRAPTVSIYNTNRKLLRKHLTDGKLVIAATKKQMRQAWHLPLTK